MAYRPTIEFAHALRRSLRRWWHPWQFRLTLSPRRFPSTVLAALQTTLTRCWPCRAMCWCWQHITDCSVQPMAAATWKEVAGGPNQIMYNSMTDKLGVSPFNPQRLYVLTFLALIPHATFGLYTSNDEGQTWKLASAAPAGFNDHHLHGSTGQ